MKRLAAVVAAVMCLMVPVGNAQVPAAFVSTTQTALSMWFERSDGEIAFYAAFAQRGPSAGWAIFPYVFPEEILGMGGVAKGKCKKFRNGMSCHASGRAYSLDPTTFTFDPLMSSAHMVIEDEQHDLVWTGLGDVPEFSSGHSSGISYVSAGGGGYRRASIEGSIFGRVLERRKPLFSALFQGADATVYTGLRIATDLDDGRFSMRVWIPSAR